MEQVYVKRVHLGDNLASGIRQCMKQYGYGFEYVVFVAEDHSYCLIATEHVEVDDDIIHAINEYYSGESVNRNIVDSSATKIITLDID